MLKFQQYQMLTQLDQKMQYDEKVSINVMRIIIGNF